MAKKQTSSSSSSEAGSKKKPAAASKATSSAASSEGAAKKTPASKAPAAKTSAAAKPSGGGAPASSPLIDTSLAANAAAALVGNKLSLNTPASAKQESAAFKNLKQKLAKPSAQGLSNILDTTNQNKKPNLPFGGGKQVAHNQTFGADVNRAGVPRRTPG